MDKTDESQEVEYAMPALTMGRHEGEFIHKGAVELIVEYLQ